MNPALSFFKRVANGCGFDISLHRPDRIGKCPFRDMRRFLSSVSQPLIFDVGANEGQTVRSFKHTFPDCLIHSFEPSPTTFAHLQEQVAHEAGVRTWNCALGAEPGRQTFLENTNSDMSSFLEPSRDSWGTVQRRALVDVMTVDRFLAEQKIARVDILKSDTQGYDLQVFKGAEEAMRRNRIGLIYTEMIFSAMYEAIPSFDEVYRHLLDRGFRLVSIYHFEYQNGLAGWADALFANPQYPGLAH